MNQMQFLFFDWITGKITCQFRVIAFFKIYFTIHNMFIMACNITMLIFFNGWMDVFVVKLDSSGNVVWSTLLGGPNYDRAYAIEVDDEEALVFVGCCRYWFPDVFRRKGPARSGGTLLAALSICFRYAGGRSFSNIGPVKNMDRRTPKSYPVGLSRIAHAAGGRFAVQPGVWIYRLRILPEDPARRGTAIR